jgi:hypothetical protein
VIAGELRRDDAGESAGRTPHGVRRGVKEAGVRLIPPSTGREVNLGERAVFQALAATPAAGQGMDTSGWSVLHALDIAEHNRRVAGEVDFLIVAPSLGVLVLEVKGVHHIGRRDGVWVLGDGPERRLDRRGPFKQASEAMHSLRERLVRARSDLGGVPFWSAACFPFLDFAEPSEEWHSWQVVDRRAMQARPLAELLAGVLENGRRRMADRHVRSFDPAAAEPTAAQCDEIVAAVRPDFEFYESPKARARRIDEEVRRYTEEQFTALDAMERNPRVIFDGPAGTGKTLLAIEAARRAVAAGRRVLFLCFNIPLRLWLADQTAELRPAGMVDRLSLSVDGACALPAPGTTPTADQVVACDGSGPGLIVRALHEQMLHVCGLEPGGRDLESSFWLQDLPEAACMALLEEQERAVAAGDGAASRLDRFDEIIVDEAQDILSHGYIDFLDLSLHGGLEHGRWRIFGDFEFQRIYRQHGSLTLDEFDADGHWPLVELRVNCRNTPAVAGFACACVGVDPRYCRVLRSEDADTLPEIHGWDDAEDQDRLLVRALETIHEEGFSWGDIAVLSPVADERCACARLNASPWTDRLERVAQYTPEVDAEKARAWVENAGAHVRCATIHRFKGLEARAVVITDVTTLDETSRALLYVGATRTVERLVVLAARDVARDLRRLLKESGVEPG